MKRYRLDFEQSGLHGAPDSLITQIPRLVPGLTLDKVSRVETLLPALTGEVLDETAKLFQIRRTWLEGVGDEIYDTVWCYKAPERFFEELARLNLHAIESGHRVPRRDLQGRRLNNVSLEDFALSPQESRQSKETEELPQVMKFIEHHDLDNVARRAFAAAVAGR